MLVGISTSNSQKLLEWIYRVLEGYGRLENFPDGSVVKNPPAHAGNSGLTHGLGRSLGEGSGSPLLYSCLGNPMDGGAWQATVHGVTKSWTQSND